MFAEAHARMATAHVVVTNCQRAARGSAVPLHSTEHRVVWFCSPGVQEANWQNHAFIAAVPNSGIKYVRIHDLLNLVTVNATAHPLPARTRAAKPNASVGTFPAPVNSPTRARAPRGGASYHACR